MGITANTVNTDDYVNPLSFDMDLEGPIDLDNEMPTIKPYNQDEIVYKETEDGKKKKSKKERKRDKKRKKKEERKQKKKKKKNGKKSKEKVDDDPNDLLNFATEQKDENNDDLLGFMKATTSTSPRAKDGDDFINDLLDLSNGNGTSHAVNNDDVKEQEDTKQKSSSKKKKKKDKQHKNGMITASAEAKQILFEDDSIRISYFAHPSNKKASTYLDIVLLTENLSSSKSIKSAKLTPSKSSSFKPKDKIMEHKLCKKLGANAENLATIKMKCTEFGTAKSNSIKCKVSYNKTTSKSLHIKLATHSFVTNDADIRDENALMELIEDNEKCKYKAKDALKLPDNVSCGDALDSLVKIWRVHNITMTDKKSTYYGKLMLDRHLAIYVKTNKNKNAIQLTLSGHAQEFLDDMLAEFKSIILN